MAFQDHDEEFEEGECNNSSAEISSTDVTMMEEDGLLNPVE